MPRRILIVSHSYPPVPSVGGNRWLAMAKYLRRAGHEVSVVTTSAFGSLPDDERDGVARAPDLISAGWLRRAFRRPALTAAGTGAATPIDRPPGALITKVVVPDHLAATWAPFAARLARRVVRDRAIDCVVTTSAYESNHLVGLALGDRRPAWIADFRDGWTFHPWKPEFPTAAQRRLDRWLERRVVQTADRVVVVERPVGDDFRERLGIEPAYIPNGWDPELEAEAASSRPPAIDPDRFTLVHTGKLSGGWGRHPGPLFEAMARLRTAEPTEAARLQLVLAGRRDSEEQRLIEGLELGGMVRHLGELPRAEALALQRHADALLLLTSRTLVWELPGKVFEYMGARRPVLALAADNEAARVVEEAGIGWTVPPDDVDAIVAALRGMLRGELADAYAPRDLEQFVYPAPAEALAAEVERAVAARALTRRA
jgi:glycosyltransferase involved in cell wall biosynthesis